MTTGVALRATLWLRARMTEQADIPATENKSPPPNPLSPHSGLLMPCGWCPRVLELQLPGQGIGLIHPSPVREEMREHAGAPGATPPPFR